MNPEIVTALISLVGSALGVICGVIGANKLTEFRLVTLENKIGELDRKIDDFTNLSVKLAVIESRLEDLEKKKQ